MRESSRIVLEERNGVWNFHYFSPGNVTKGSLFMVWVGMKNLFIFLAKQRRCSLRELFRKLLGIRIYALPLSYLTDSCSWLDLYKRIEISRLEMIFLSMTVPTDGSEMNYSSAGPDSANIATKSVPSTNERLDKSFWAVLIQFCCRFCTEFGIVLICTKSFDFGTCLATDFLYKS